MNRKISIDHCERLKAQADLFEKLATSRAQSALGDKGITHKQMMTKLRRKIKSKQIYSSLTLFFYIIPNGILIFCGCVFLEIFHP
jgi:hypothetical protein